MHVHAHALCDRRISLAREMIVSAWSSQAVRACGRGHQASSPFPKCVHTRRHQHNIRRTRSRAQHQRSTEHDSLYAPCGVHVCVCGVRCAMLCSLCAVHCDDSLCGVCVCNARMMRVLYACTAPSDRVVALLVR